MADQFWDIVTLIFLIAGTVLMVLGAVGVLRLPDVYMRAQASSKTSTLGIVFIFIAVATSFREMLAVSEAIAIVAFAFLSVPVAAHMVIRAAHAVGIEPCVDAERDQLRASDDDEFQAVARPGADGGDMPS